MALDFPTSPTDGQVYGNFIWDATNGLWRSSRSSIAGLQDVSILSPVVGDSLIFNGTDWANTNTYQFKQLVVFTASGTFTKASYPWLRAIKVRMQAGGGGSGGCLATTATQNSMSDSGGGGAYAEFLLTSVSALSASATVTIGAGGTAGAAGLNAGGAGGATVFDTYQVSGGASGGAGQASSTNRIITGGAGGATFTNIPTGSLTIAGGDGQYMWALGATTPGYAMRASGGDSFLGRGGVSSGGTTFATGGIGTGYGGGASGCFNAASQATARAGAAGAPGILILELFA